MQKEFRSCELFQLRESLEVFGALVSKIPREAWPLLMRIWVGSEITKSALGRKRNDSSQCK
jgi:hypothetical protein